MRTLILAAAAALLLPACTIEGPPADGNPFGIHNFADADTARTAEASVDSACQTYCDGADGCGLISDIEGCYADCIEPMLAAATATPAEIDCSSAYQAAMACTVEPVCEEYEACDEALDAYMACALTL